MNNCASTPLRVSLLVLCRVEAQQCHTWRGKCRLQVHTLAPMRGLLDRSSRAGVDRTSVLRKNKQGPGTAAYRVRAVGRPCSPTPSLVERGSAPSVSFIISYHINFNLQVPDPPSALVAVPRGSTREGGGEGKAPFCLPVLLLCRRGGAPAHSDA